MKTMIVTRHRALVEYMREIGLVKGEVEVLPHVTEEQVKDAHVIGVLPLSLAAAAESVTEVPLQIPPELRGKELSLEEVRKYAGSPRTYTVLNVK